MDSIFASLQPAAVLDHNSGIAFFTFKLIAAKCAPGNGQ
jgi:hypothetical protein